jgi:polyhydroxybutyrate depolymerase
MPGECVRPLDSDLDISRAFGLRLRQNQTVQSRQPGAKMAFGQIRVLGIVTVFTAVLLAVSACNDPPSSAIASLSCGSGGPVPGSDDKPIRPYQELTMTMSSGEERMFLLRLPDGYDGDMPSDVVFNFHGAGSNAHRQIAYADFSELADRDNVIIVAPDANKVYPDRDHELATYWDSAWEGTQRERDHDIVFVLELVEKLQADYCTGNFYATGMSAGGDMTTALQCDTEGPFLAYAPVTYRYYHEDECSGARPRPMISFHGTEDRVVPLGGLPAPWFDPHVGVIMQSWAEVNGCDPQAIEESYTKNVTRYRWSNCEAKTEWYLIEGGGHTWPGGAVREDQSHTAPEISASEMIWDFFFEANQDARLAPVG